MSLYIVACGQYCDNVGDEQPPLKALVAESIGKSVRRIDRFIQLALIGAGRASAGLPAASGVYYASGCGDVQITVELLSSIYRKRQAPKPLSFVNSVSNAASFYVSSCLGLHGPSSFVTSRYFAYESALSTAALELEQGVVDSALVGVVDIVLPPLRDHCERLGLDEDTVVAEASHWLQLRRSAAGEVLAQLDRIEYFSDRDNLGEVLRELSGGQSRQPSPQRDMLAFNQFFDADDRQWCLQQSGLQEYAYSSPYGHFESRTGELIHDYLLNGSGSLWLVSGDVHGRYQLIGFSKPLR